MQRQAKKWAPLALAAVVLVGLLAAVVGCQAPGSRIGTGSLLLNLDNRQAKSLLPPISMDVVEYLVSATGPMGATYGPELLTGSTVIEDLLPGSWSFTVVGRNAAHNDIGAGSGSAAVVIGQTAVCSIVVGEYDSPDGSFLLDLAWEPDIVAWPVWSGSLKDFAAAETAMGFTVDELACTAQSLTDPLHVGWFTMVVKLFDAPDGLDGSEVLSTGAACAVRIAAGRQTHGDLFLHAVQGFGTIDLQLDLDFHDPLVLTPNVPFGDNVVYGEADYTFNVTADETCTSVFYLLGQQVATGSYTLNAGDLIDGETYRLDVVAFNTDGSRAASGTWNVQRIAVPPGAFDIVAQVNNQTTSSQVVMFYLHDPEWGGLDGHEITIPAQSVGSWTFGNLPVGSYYLGMRFGTQYRYWLGPGTWVPGEQLLDATLIAVPGSPPTAHVCSFGNL